VFNRSKRIRTIEPPPPVDPISGRPYGQPAPVRDERDEAELAAGQAALATARVPAPIQVGFRPNSGWAGARH
jgi:hypothetical protein